MHANPKKVGFVGGTVLGGLHLIWSLLIFLGWAQPLLNFSMWAHMIHFVVIVGPFDASAAAAVVVVASCVGYALGYVIATAWNKVHHG
jgi:hypothetical protein